MKEHGEIKEWTAEEARGTLRHTEFMKAFEDASSEITVDVQYAHDSYQELLEKGVCKIYYAETEEKQIQGTIGFIITNDLHDGKKMAIEAFWFVDPRYKGLGKKLFDRFELEAKKLGCKKLGMVHMVDSYPDSLKKFYEKSGYKLLELHYIKEI
ncbi:MAG: GNAT family N-acetyltransferase [Desulfobacterales bacterium]|nr:GNAT family N-acetyltransferase [Desulfobacterales bacterium]